MKDEPNNTDAPQPMPVDLGILGRITLLQILPAEGNLLTMRTVQAVRAALSFTDDEQSAFGLTTAVNAEGQANITWRLEEGDDGVRPVTISARGLVLIEDTLKALNGQSKLTEAHLGLWDKFVLAEA